MPPHVAARKSNENLSHYHHLTRTRYYVRVPTSDHRQSTGKKIAREARSRQRIIRGFIAKHYCCKGPTKRPRFFESTRTNFVLQRDLGSRQNRQRERTAPTDHPTHIFRDQRPPSSHGTSWQQAQPETTDTSASFSRPREGEPTSAYPAAKGEQRAARTRSRFPRHVARRSQLAPNRAPRPLHG